MLNYYELEGRGESPNSLDKLDKLRQQCPDLELSCCSDKDIDSLESKWEKAKQRMEDYGNQLVYAINTSKTLKDILQPHIEKIIEDSSGSCKRINTQVFRYEVAVEPVIAAFKLAFGALAFIQKGFLCSLCNFSHQRFYQMPKAESIGKFLIKQGSCKQLVDYVVRFLKYKVYFIDPLFINLNLVNNCVQK